MKNLIRFLTKNSFVFLFVFLLFISFAKEINNKNTNKNTKEFLVKNRIKFFITQTPLI